VRWQAPATDRAAPYRERAALGSGPSCHLPRQSGTPAAPKA
jgi:hypothetical protein